MHRTFPSYGVHFPADIVFIISRIKTYTRNTKQRDRVHNSYMRHVHIRASLHVCNNNIYTYRNRPNTRMLPCTLTPLYLNRMGWVKASALGVGDCNFTHDVTHVPLPRFLPPLYVTSLLRMYFAFVQYIYSTQSMENLLFSLSPFLSLFFSLGLFSLSSPRFLLSQFNRQHSALPFITSQLSNASFPPLLEPQSYL